MLTLIILVVTSIITLAVFIHTLHKTKQTININNIIKACNNNNKKHMKSFNVTAKTLNASNHTVNASKMVNSAKKNVDVNHVKTNLIVKKDMKHYKH